MENLCDFLQHKLTSQEAIFPSSRQKMQPGYFFCWDSHVTWFVDKYYLINQTVRLLLLLTCCLRDEEVEQQQRFDPWPSTCARWSVHAGMREESEDPHSVFWRSGTGATRSAASCVNTDPTLNAPPLPMRCLQQVNICSHSNRKWQKLSLHNKSRIFINRSTWCWFLTF